MTDTVLYDLSDGLATITLNRPEAMNSLTVATKIRLLEVLGEASKDPAVRSVLLTGAGRAFCAGQDLKEHAANLDAGRGLAGTVEEHYNPIIRLVTEMDKPVVAAVNGVAAGAGASLAFACDFRIASPSASFSMAFSQIGLAPDTGASWTLPRLIGHARALEMLVLARPVSAADALDIGLVNSVADDAPAAAKDLAVRLAHGPTRAYGATKRALAYGAAHPLSETLDLEAALQDACAETDDHINATAAFLKKEKPTFEGH